MGTEWEQAAPETLDMEWVQAFTPFDHEEAARLGLYVEQVEGMLACRFLKESMSLTLRGEREPGEMRTELTYVGEDQLRIFMTFFRPLYLTDDPGGFRRTRSMLRQHAIAKATPDAEQVRMALDNYGRAESDARKHGNPLAMHVPGPDGTQIEIRGE